MNHVFYWGLDKQGCYGTSGLHNLSGNAAEMVSERGFTKGGCDNDPGYDVRISSIKYYEEPFSEIGFRDAMEIIEK